MVGELEPLEIETRLRATLMPPGEVVDRVVRRALAGGRQQPRSAYLRLPAAVVALALLAGGTMVWRQGVLRRPMASSMTIVGDGSMLVVEREDGRRWLVGPRRDRRTQGHYVIVVAE
jgi:hypothetical protein